MARALRGLEFGPNGLFLNPRLPPETAQRFKAAWHELVEPRFKEHVGLTTSGSSGESQGRLIILSKTALEESARAVNERFGSGPHDVWFKSLPLFHVGGLGILIRAQLSGASVYEDRSGKWNAQNFYDQVTASKATLISLVPTQVFDLVQFGLRSPKHVRAVIVGGGRLEDQLRLRALELGWPCLPSYGMTETSSQIATARSIDDSRLVLLSHASARTATDGRIEIKATSLLSAQIQWSPNAHLIDPKQDGWLTAEDHAQVNNRVVTILGRSGDFVKVGGEGVNLARLEEHLEKHKLDSKFNGDAAILAAHDERLGAVIVLIFTCPDSVAEDSAELGAADEVGELVANFNAGVAPFERIREVRRLNEIPRSPLGKLLRGSAFELIGRRSAQALA